MHVMQRHHAYISFSVFFNFITLKEIKILVFAINVTIFLSAKMDS